METGAPTQQDLEQPVTCEELVYETQSEANEPLTTREELLSRYGDRTLTYGNYKGTVAEIIKGDVCPHFKSMPDLALIKTVEVILVANDAKAKAEETTVKEQTLPVPKQQPEKVAEDIATMVAETEKITAPLLKYADEVIDVMSRQHLQRITELDQVAVQTVIENVEPAVDQLNPAATNYQPIQTVVTRVEAVNEQKPLHEAFKIPEIVSSIDTEIHPKLETTTSDNIVLEPGVRPETLTLETMTPVVNAVELPAEMAEFVESAPDSDTSFSQLITEGLEEIDIEPNQRLIIMTEAIATPEETAEYDELITDGFETLDENQIMEVKSLVLEIVGLLEIIQDTEKGSEITEFHKDKVILLIKSLVDMIGLTPEPVLLQRLTDILVQKVQIHELSYLELLKLKNTNGTSEHLLYGLGKSLQNSFSLHSLLGRYVLTQLA